MADGRVAKVTISPGIGCTVYQNDSGKALSATFFSNTISTDSNSKMTVVVASASTVLTKQEVLWQPSYCLRCYSGFITCKPECQAYPDPAKMAAAYTCGIFQSNIGTGQSGTPGMNRCLFTCFNGTYTPRRQCSWPGCYSWRVACTCPQIWCCYSERFTALNCCATGGARFTRPMQAMVAAGTTYSGYVHPTPNSMAIQVYNCIGRGTCKNDAPFWMSCYYNCGNGCDIMGAKYGWMCACCVPVIWGGTEVINPAIAFTFAPLYDGTRSGFTTTTGGCWRCDCFQGPMWASQITGVYPGFRQYTTEQGAMMMCGCTSCCCLCCRGYCCCGSSAPSFAGQKGRHGTCTDGTVINEYFWTRCNTPNVNDAMRRVVAPYDDVGIGGTGIPWCYCNGSEPAFSNQKGGNPCNLQGARNYIGDCYDLGGCNCRTSQMCGTNYDVYRKVNWIVDWYMLTATCNWCHCELCVGRWTNTNTSDPVNETCCECWCDRVCACNQGGNAWCCALYQACMKPPMMLNFDTFNWVSGSPRLCVRPCSDQCGTWCITIGNAGAQYYCVQQCGCDSISGATRYGGRMIPIWHNHSSVWPTTGCCCGAYNPIAGHCCWQCFSQYSGCNCGPQQEGCCNTFQPCERNRCGHNQFGIGYIGGGAGSYFYGHASPYGVNFAYSNGILAHWHHCDSYRQSKNFQGNRYGYSFTIPRFSDFGGWCCAQWQECCKGIPILFMPVPCVAVYVTCDADICGGEANAPIKYMSDNISSAQAFCVTRDSTGTLNCALIPGVVCQWDDVNCASAQVTEFPMKYFAYNPFDDCHYFMLRTDEFTYKPGCGWDDTNMGCIRKYHESGNAQQKGAFLPDMKTCLLTNNWMCGIFSINCQALNEYQRNNRCHCGPCCGICCHCCANTCRYFMCYDGGTKFPAYKEYSCWGRMWCTGNTVPCGGPCTTCCICEIVGYQTWPCEMKDWMMSAATPCFGLRWDYSNDCFWTDNGGATCSGTTCYCRQFAGLGTVFFRKVGNFPSIMTDYKYTQPLMCVGCLFRSDSKLWSLPVYNHCEYRWDTFLSCDLKEWNKQEFVKCTVPPNQMTAVCDCCILNLTENYLCRCTDCFMSGFNREGLVELCLSFNQYERTGIVLSENDLIYVKNNDDNQTGKCINFQVWGYEG